MESPLKGTETITLDEALKMLRKGGDMDLHVSRDGGPMNYVFQVRDDHLLFCMPGPDLKLYSGKRLMTSERAVLELMLAVSKNAFSGGVSHLVMQ